MVGSLIPFKITLLLNLTSHFVSVKITLHPALHRIRIPISEAIDNPGTICPVRIIGRPGMLMSHMCVEWTMSPFGRFMVSGSVAGRMFFMGVPAITKIDVAPVSAMACVSENASVLGTPCRRAEAMLRAEATFLFRDVFDVMTVASSLSCTTLHCMGSKA